VQKSASSILLNIRVSIIVLTLSLFLGGCGGGNKSEPLYNITGSWYVFHTTNGTAGEQGLGLFKFTQSENSLSGTAPPNQLITGNVSNTTATFSWTGSDGTAYTYTGTVSDNGTTAGSWTGSNGQSGTWHAIINVLPSVNITGNWQITYATNETNIEFSQSGNIISSTTSQEQLFTGIVSGLTITFSWVGSDGATYIFTGAVNVDGTTMSGTWINTNGQSGTWSATKS
jgi:hypothetical protein